MVKCARLLGFPLSNVSQGVTVICNHLSGAICIPIFLPLTVLFLICVSRSPEASVLQWPPPLPSTDQLWDRLAPVVLLSWIALHALLYLMPLGKVRRVHKPGSSLNEIQLR